MITAMVLVLFRRRGVRLRMPRVPYSLAAVLAYLYAARMLDGLVGLSTLGKRRRDIVIKDICWGKGYGLGWTIGLDGEKRVGVDEEELEGMYNPSNSWKTRSVFEASFL
jgi:hypothetical protein